MFKLIRRHGHQLWVVYTAIQVLQHEKNGQSLTVDDYDMICFFTGLDIEQVSRAVRLLLDNNLICGSESEFFNQEVKNDLEKIVKKRNVYQENANKRWNKKQNNQEIKEDIKVDAMAMQLHCNGNANLMNMNTEYEDQNIRILENQKIENKTFLDVVNNCWLQYLKDVHKRELDFYSIDAIVAMASSLGFTVQDLEQVIIFSKTTRARNIIWDLDKARNKKPEIKANPEPKRVYPKLFKPEPIRQVSDTERENNKKILAEKFPHLARAK